jgi:hypothetical protein
MHKYFIQHALFIIWAALMPSSLCAQQLFGNEWIFPGQIFLRIPIAQTGFYNISPEDLSSAGFPTDSASGAGFQMFRRGKEFAIEVVSKKDQRTTINFYGERNDGALDTALYVTPKTIPHTHYSLYSDTSAYFLTCRLDGVVGKRVSYANVFATDTADYHFVETEKLFISHYAPGNFYPPQNNFNDGSALSTYDIGEGWTGPEIKENGSESFSIDLENVRMEKFNEAQIELVVVGRSAGNHTFDLWTSDDSRLKRKLTTLNFKDYNTTNFTASLAASDLETGRKITFTLVPKENEGTISVSYAKLHYPQKRISKPYEPKPIPKARTAAFENIDPKQFDYLIITHPAVRKLVNNKDPVLEYAAYRASDKGGRYKPLIINSEDIYDQFNFGEPGPLGIKKLVSWLTNSGNLKFVFLIGKSIDPQTARKLPDARSRDMVPNAGWPGSDIAMVMDANQSEPTVPIGRLNASNAQQVADYLQKVKAMEAEAATAPWRKNILHLSGGRSREEQAVFLGYIQSFEQKITQSALAAHVETISKKTTNAVEKLPIHVPVNKGVSLMTIFGHSSLDVTDIDIGLVSDPSAQIQNHPRYPAIIVNGCAAGSIFYSTKTLSSDWIMGPNNGALLFLAHTFNGLSTDLKHYTEHFYGVLADSAFTHKPFGIIQNEAIRRNLMEHKDITALITAQQMVLHGDPAIRIFPAILPGSTSHSDNVLPEKLSPILLVKVDSRLLQNGDFVSKEPIIEIQVTDDDHFLARHDTSGIMVWIKEKCADCVQQRIYFNNASWKTISSSDFLITLKGDKPFNVGEYTLYIQASDSNGNIAPPYIIEFKVSGLSDIRAISVSPNPSNHWFRFAIEYGTLPLPEKVSLSIYDHTGKNVFEKQLKAHSGKNEWLWHPENLPSGVYTYKLETEAANQPISQEVQKMLRGKLIWIH